MRQSIFDITAPPFFHILYVMLYVIAYIYIYMLNVIALNSLQLIVQF